eukprot:6201027-Pleurochrysis_carterae.AAC.3
MVAAELDAQRAQDPVPAFKLQKDLIVSQQALLAICERPFGLQCVDRPAETSESVRLPISLFTCGQLQKDQIVLYKRQARELHFRKRTT